MQCGHLAINSPDCTCFSLASDISNQLISQVFLASFYRYQFFQSRTFGSSILKQGLEIPGPETMVRMGWIRTAVQHLSLATSSLNHAKLIHSTQLGQNPHLAQPKGIIWPHRFGGFVGVVPQKKIHQQPSKDCHEMLG